jgi:hypothetical protein
VVGWDVGFFNAASLGGIHQSGIFFVHHISGLIL